MFPHFYRRQQETDLPKCVQLVCGWSGNWTQVFSASKAGTWLLSQPVLITRGFGWVDAFGGPPSSGSLCLPRPCIPWGIGQLRLSVLDRGFLQGRGHGLLRILINQALSTISGTYQEMNGYMWSELMKSKFHARREGSSTHFLMGLRSSNASPVIPQFNSFHPVRARIQNELFRVSPVPNQNLNFTIMSPKLSFAPWACDVADLSRGAKGTPWEEARIQGTEMTHQVVKGSNCAKWTHQDLIHVFI